jgi:hypothetical protein
MRTLLLITIAGVSLAQTPLTEVEKLKIENASLKLAALDQQKQAIQKEAQGVFEAACKRAKIDLPACQFDAQTQSVRKAETKAGDEK